MNKPKTKTAKLTLNKDTVRTLSTKQLNAVAGGGGASGTCWCRASALCTI